MKKVRRALDKNEKKLEENKGGEEETKKIIEEKKDLQMKFNYIRVNIIKYLPFFNLTLS